MKARVGTPVRKGGMGTTCGIYDIDTACDRCPPTFLTLPLTEAWSNSVLITGRFKIHDIMV